MKPYERKRRAAGSFHELLWLARTSLLVVRARACTGLRPHMYTSMTLGNTIYTNGGGA